MQRRERWRPNHGKKRRRRMIEEMAQIHTTEAEVAENFAAALEKVRQGLEVVVKSDREAIAVLRPAEPPRRKISECIAMLPADSMATIDADFAGDVEPAIAAHRESLEPPAWD
jgi:antitoxin (DNA-binding transcriptional repressor) of toxin-antitoxin stability system